MFFNANVTWQRISTILQQRIPADIQDMDVPEARDLQAQSPTEAFWIFTDHIYDIKKGDFLIKEEDTTEVYRVFARVRKYSEHLEIPAELLSDDERQLLFAKEKPLEEEKNTSWSNEVKETGYSGCKSRLSSRQNLGLKSGMDNWLQARSEGGGPSDLEGANATGSFPRMR